MIQIKRPKELASLIAKIEGKKSQARIGDIREILGILSDLVFDEKVQGVWATIYLNGKRRFLRKRKKK